MKMKIWDRLLLALYAILGLCGLAAVGGAIFAPEMTARVADKLRSAWDDRLIRIAICAVALVILVWTIRVFLLAFKHEPRHDRGSVAVQNTENGSVRVSVQAMDALVRQAIGSSEGVVDIKSRIINHEDSISVKIEMTLSGDAHIPNVTMLLQRNIKSFIEEFSGIAVRDVSVLVTSIVPVEGPVAIAEKAQSVQDNGPEIVVEPESATAHAEEAAQEAAPEAEARVSEMEDAPSFEPAAEEDAPVMDEAVSFDQENHWREDE